MAICQMIYLRAWLVSALVLYMLLTEGGAISPDGNIIFDRSIMMIEVNVTVVQCS